MLLAVIDRVCRQTHVVEGHTLQVKLYHELLGSGSDEGPKFKVPDHVVITDTDPRKIQFLKTSPPNRKALEKQLLDRHTIIHWPEKLADAVKLECLVTADMKDCRKLVKAWKTTGRESLDKFLEILAVTRHQILQDTWEGVLNQLQGMNITHPDGVSVAVEAVSFEIFVMGHKAFVNEVSQSIEKIISGIAAELERKKQHVTETTSPLKHHQIIMLSHKHYTDAMEKRFPGMKVKLDFKAKTLTFEGLYGEVTDAKLDMYQTIQAMVSSDVGEFNKGRYKYLQDKDVKQYVAGKMKAESIVAVWEMQDQRFVVYAMSDDGAVRAAHILKGSVLETIVDVKKESSPLLSSEKWSDEEKVIKGNCHCVVQLKVDVKKPCIIIYSTDTDAEMVRECVNDFLTMNTIYTTKLSISTGMLRFLQEGHKAKIQGIEKNLQADQVTISMNNMGIEIKGTEVGLNKAKQSIGQVMDTIEKKEHVLRKPGITKLMTSDNGQDKVSKVEKLHNVVIVPSDGSESSEEDVGGKWGGGGVVPGRKDGLQEVARCSRPDYHLMVMRGDITSLKVDVVVNAANKDLKHMGGLAAVIVHKGKSGALKLWNLLSY